MPPPRLSTPITNRPPADFVALFGTCSVVENCFQPVPTPLTSAVAKEVLPSPDSSETVTGAVKPLEALAKKDTWYCRPGTIGTPK